MFMTSLSKTSVRGLQEPIEIAAFLADADSRAVVEQVDGGARHGRHIQSGRVAEAITYIKTSTAAPKVLIVDISGIELPLSEIDRLAEVCEPSVRVLVVGDRQDIGLFRALLKLGVADYLVKPLSAALITPHLAGAPALAMGAANARSGKLVVVSGASGGVGATTIAVNLAWQMAAEDHRRIALVDFDMYSQAMAIQLNVKSDGGLLEALANSTELDPQFLDNAMVRCHPRLAVLNSELQWNDSVDLKVEQLEDLIKMLERHHHYVIVDLPRRPGPAYTYLLRRAHLRVVVTNRSLTATRDCGRILDLVENLGGRTVLVLNEERPGSGGMLAQDALEAALRQKFDLKIGFHRTAAAQSDGATSGQPLAATNRPFARAMAALASNISGRTMVGGSAWRRLFGRA